MCTLETDQTLVSFLALKICQFCPVFGQNQGAVYGSPKLKDILIISYIALDYYSYICNKLLKVNW